MSVRMRHTSSHTANRRSHHALSEVRLATCQKCGAAFVSHRMCENCGFYKGRQVQDVLARASKREAKKKEKAKA